MYDEKYKESLDLGFDYVKDRKMTRSYPYEFKLNVALNNCEFNIDSITKIIQSEIEKFKHNISTVEVGEPQNAVLVYDYIPNIHWTEMNCYDNEKKLYICFDRYETEYEFLQRKRGKPKSPEEKKLFETRKRKRQIEEFKSSLKDLSKEDLNNIFTELLNNCKKE